MHFAGEDGYFQIIVYAIAIVGWLISTIYKNKRKFENANKQESESTIFPEELFNPVEESTQEYVEPSWPSNSGVEIPEPVEIVHDEAVEQADLGAEKGKQVPTTLAMTVQEAIDRQKSGKSDDYYSSQEYTSGMEIGAESESKITKALILKRL